MKNYFAVNLKHLRSLKEYSQQSLADEIGVSRSTLNNWERGASMPALKILSKLSKVFSISLDDIVSIDLSEFTQLPKREEHIKILTISDDQVMHGNIELVEMKAEAGYMENFNNPSFLKELPRIYFPNIPKGHFRGFEISGESMLPIESGSIVICSFVERIEEVKDGRSYVVATQNGLVYKRLFREEKRNAFLMVSDNTQYMPYTLEFEEVKEIWQFYALLSFSDGQQMLDSFSDNRINDMHEKLNHVHRHIIS